MLPAELARVVPTDTAAVWAKLVLLLPEPLYLAGGTGLAAHLHHRTSRDLDFFYHGHAVDLDALELLLGRELGLAITSRASGTLNGVISRTKVQFLHADERQAQRLLDPPTVIGGLRVAGLRDLLAMKLKVIGDRGELRDYFDVMRVEQDGRHTVAEGLGFFLARFAPASPSDAIGHIVRALGYLDDVEDDLQLPVGRREIEAYWRRRQPEILTEIARGTAT